MARSLDQLQVQLSTDCGQSWTTVFTRSSALVTAPNSTTAPWVPTNCSQWSRNSIDLSAYDGAVIQLRFVAINGGTGRLYMDNVQLMNEEVVLSLKVFLEGPSYRPPTPQNYDNPASPGSFPAQNRTPNWASNAWPIHTTTLIAAQYHGQQLLWWISAVELRRRLSLSR
ncbi:MAG: hypothetical protein R2818_04235 [Flavobacteriales bacterium]